MTGTSVIKVKVCVHDFFFSPNDSPGKDYGQCFL